MRTSAVNVQGVNVRVDVRPRHEPGGATLLGVIVAVVWVACLVTWWLVRGLVALVVVIARRGKASLERGNVGGRSL